MSETREEFRVVWKTAKYSDRSHVCPSKRRAEDCRKRIRRTAEIRDIEFTDGPHIERRTIITSEWERVEE